MPGAHRAHKAAGDASAQVLMGATELCNPTCKANFCDMPGIDKVHSGPHTCEHPRAMTSSSPCFRKYTRKQGAKDGLITGATLQFH